MNREATSPTGTASSSAQDLPARNAALVLAARAGASGVDNAAPRNYATHEMHGVLGHDGLDPRSCVPAAAASSRATASGRDPRSQDAEVLDGAARATSAGRRTTRTVLPPPGCSTSPDIPASPTSGNQRPVPTATASSTATTPAVLAAGDRGDPRCCCTSGQTTSSCSAMARTTSLPDQSARVQAVGVPSSRCSPSAGQPRQEPAHVRLGDGQTPDRDALFFYVGWRLRNDVARALDASCA